VSFSGKPKAWDDHPVAVHHYGDTYVGGEFVQRSTIHGSGTIDIQIDPLTREVKAVWFRCLELPFRVSEHGGGDGPERDIAVTAIEYLEP